MGVVVERADSLFGRYTTAIWHDPHDPLLPNVRIWYFDGTLAHAYERHYPDGTCGIIVQLDTPHAPEGAAPGERFPAICTNGLATRQFAIVAPPGRCRVLGIVCDPMTLHAALRRPLAELTDVTIDLNDAIGRAGAELGTRCAAARDPATVVAAALDWLRAQVASGSPADAAVTHALRRLQHARGALSIAVLHDETGLAASRLTRRFAEIIGTTPKRFGRILRFHHALGLIRHAPRADLAAVAQTAGYYDQAHMYADFSEFCDRTPAAFARALHYPQGLSIAENEPTADFSTTG